jgi:lysozyme
MTPPAIQIAKQFLKERERLVLHCYDDQDAKARPLKPGAVPAGVPTIGFGHTGRYAAAGNVITEIQADSILDEDIRPCDMALRRDLKPEILRQLDPYQIAALISFIFNVGVGAWQKSTVLRKLNAGDLEAFPSEAPRWNKATVYRDGKKTKITMDGLTKRRAEEVLLWQTPATPADEEAAAPVPVAVAAEPPSLARSTTVQGISVGGAGAVAGIIIQVMGGMSVLPTPVQLGLLGTATVTVLGLAWAFRGRLRLRLREGV